MKKNHILKYKYSRTVEESVVSVYVPQISGWGHNIFNLQSFQNRTVSEIDYTLIPANIAPGNRGNYLTANNGMFLLDLREHLSDDVEAVARFDRSKFTSGSDKMQSQIINCFFLITAVRFTNMIE